MDVVQGFGPAWERMAQVLFRPFELKKWLALGFISLIAYAGSGNFNVGNWGNNGGGNHDKSLSLLGTPDIVSVIGASAAVIAAVVALVALGILWSWLASIFHMIYIDDITRNSGAVREPFARLKGLGTSYFLWRLVFGFIILFALGILVALPLVAVFVPNGVGVPAKVIAVIWAVFVGLGIIFFGVLADVFARDFVTATMYVRGIRIMEAWRIVLPILRANVGQIALYVLLLIAIAMGMALFSVIMLLAALIVFAIPAGILFGIGYLIWAAAHLTPESAGGIALIVIGIPLGISLILAFVYALQCAYQPAEIFRRAYALVVWGQADPSFVTIPIHPNQPPAIGEK